jgi:hypothetical protein
MYITDTKPVYPEKTSTAKAEKPADVAIPWTPEGTRDERSGTDARGHRAVGFVHGIFDPRDGP